MVGGWELQSMFPLHSVHLVRQQFFLVDTLQVLEIDYPTGPLLELTRLLFQLLPFLLALQLADVLVNHRNAIHLEDGVDLIECYGLLVGVLSQVDSLVLQGHETVTDVYLLAIHYIIVEFYLLHIQPPFSG